MSLWCLGIKRGDEVITSPISFIASVSSIIHVGAKPVFVDIKDDYNIDVDKIEQAITSKTKAIIPVHWSGLICDMKKISKIANKYKTTSVLKGPGTLVCQGDRLNINTSGSPSMASAGMGDVLSGIIAALLAQGLDEFDAANLAVYVHGQAAENLALAGSKGLLASDLFSEIRRILG